MTNRETHILQLIQQLYGAHNTADKCVKSDSGETVLFVKDEEGDTVIMVSLSAIADIARDDHLSDEEIEKSWLTPR